MVLVWLIPGLLTVCVGGSGAVVPVLVIPPLLLLLLVVILGVVDPIGKVLLVLLPEGDGRIGVLGGARVRGLTLLLTWSEEGSTRSVKSLVGSIKVTQ